MVGPPHVTPKRTRRLASFMLAAPRRLLKVESNVYQSELNMAHAAVSGNSRNPQDASFTLATNESQTVDHNYSPERRHHRDDFWIWTGRTIETKSIACQVTRQPEGPPLPSPIHAHICHFPGQNRRYGERARARCRPSLQSRAQRLRGADLRLTVYLRALRPRSRMSQSLPLLLLARHLHALHCLPKLVVFYRARVDVISDECILVLQDIFGFRLVRPSSRRRCLSLA
jgi:hypothetical protein